MTRRDSVEMREVKCNYVVLAGEGLTDEFVLTEKLLDELSLAPRCH